jgi:hypothetical protein
MRARGVDLHRMATGESPFFGQLWSASEMPGPRVCARKSPHEMQLLLLRGRQMEQEQN